MQIISRPAEIENVSEMIEWMLKIVSEHREMSDKTGKDLRLIGDEILSNIAFYAYEDTKGDMKLSVDFADKTDDIVLCFMDTGVEFDPLRKDDPDLDVDIMDRQIGGLGIYLTKQLSRDVLWKREDGINKLTVIKAYE